MSKHEGDLISRRAAIETLRKSHEAHADNSREISLLDRDIRLLEEEPAVDAVEVVRCGECKHYADNSFSKLKTCYVHLLTPHPMPEDAFCSYGERKEGDE